MSDENSWGIQKYYTTYNGNQDSSGENNLAASTWITALATVNPNARKQVELAKDKWNSRVRELLRSETGLKFLRAELAETKQIDIESSDKKQNNSASDESLKKAPIKIVDGFPPPLERYFEGLMKDADILLRRQDFAQAKTTLEFAEENFIRLLEYTRKNDGHVNPKTLQDVSEFLDGLVLEADHRSLIDRILAIDEDCLGAYFFTRPEIHIYWLPIAILAQCSSEADIESLTFIVLAHELAHAYSHQGKDIDGSDWHTEPFAHSDKRIVEGIAQYYTRQLCRRLKSHAPQFERTFEWMLERQPEPYTRFLGWINEAKNAGQNQHGEVVRAAMLQTRREPIIDLIEFENRIHEYRDRLGVRK